MAVTVTTTGDAERAAREQQLRAARDLRLVRAFRAGRAEAFEQLLRAYDGQVRRILAHLDVAGADVEDLVQDVFVRVFRNMHRFREESSFYTWLYRITVNVFFDHAKKCKRADARLARLQHALAEDATLRRVEHDPYDAVEETLVRDRFAQAIAALPEPFRDVVALREVDDLSYEEIAVQTGVSIGTVRSRLARARVRLKALLRPSFLAA